MRQTVVPAGRGSRVRLEVDYELPGGPLGGLLDAAVVERQTEQEADRSLQKLKELLEG